MTNKDNGLGDTNELNILLWNIGAFDKLNHDDIVKIQQFIDLKLSSQAKNILGAAPVKTQIPSDANAQILFAREIGRNQAIDDYTAAIKKVIKSEKQ